MSGLLVSRNSAVAPRRVRTRSNFETQNVEVMLSSSSMLMICVDCIRLFAWARAASPADRDLSALLLCVISINCLGHIILVSRGEPSFLDLFHYSALLFMMHAILAAVRSVLAFAHCTCYSFLLKFANKRQPVHRMSFDRMHVNLCTCNCLRVMLFAVRRLPVAIALTRSLAKAGVAWR